MALLTELQKYEQRKKCTYCACIVLFGVRIAVEEPRLPVCRKPDCSNLLSEKKACRISIVNWQEGNDAST